MTDDRLLTFANAKTPKGESKGYLTGILYLVPSDGSGLGNLCPFASAGCRAACLYTAGRGVMKPIQDGRLRKTRLFFEDAPRFVDMLVKDISRLVRRGERKGMLPAVRLNGTSDIPWERMRGTQGHTLMEMFPAVQFYDYTKRPRRFNLPPNYNLTFSLSETNLVDAMAEFKYGRNVAVVFPTRKGDPLPSTWHGLPVIDGDESDLRFTDKRGVIVGLRAKGRAKGEATGFVQVQEAA